MTAAEAPAPGRWTVEFAALLRIGAPLIAAQLATIALTTTDVVMMGWLGPEELAAGALSNALVHPLFMFGTGVCVAVAALAAQALGARKRRDVRRTVRQGLWIAALLAALLIPPLTQGGAILAALGQSPDVAALAGNYLRWAAWMLAPALAFVVLRSFLSAHGDTRVVLVATLIGVGVNALGNYALMFGAFGLPRLEMTGAGISTVATHCAMTLTLAAYVRWRWRRYALFARFHRADWPRFLAILRMGAPIGLTLAAETGLFGGVALLMGWLGPDELAGHAAAIQLASIAFMAPLGLGQAATVRVGLAVGARDAAGAAQASWVAVGATAAFMAATAAVFILAPEPLVALFIDPEAAPRPFALAVTYLAVAGLFQLVDGAQVSALCALRGLGDTRAPMVIAITGYWLMGLPAALALGFLTPLEGVGVWLGLAVGLAAAGGMLMLRLRRLLGEGAVARA